MQRFVSAFVILTILGAALVRGFDEKAALAKFAEYAEACQAEVGATPNDLQELLKKQAASTYEGKCLRACVFKKCGFMNASGKMDVAVGREKANEHLSNDPAKLKLALEMNDKCSAIAVPDDHCEAAEEYGSCIHNEATKLGLM